MGFELNAYYVRIIALWADVLLARNEMWIYECWGYRKLE